MRDVFVISAVRSPIGRFGGVLREWSPAELAAPVLREAASRAGLSAEDVDLVVFGNVLRGGHGQLVPRQATLQAGFPDSVDAVALDMVCASGMMGVITAAAHIRAGDAEVVLAGGVESMSGAGFFVGSGARNKLRYEPGDADCVSDMLLVDGLTNPLSGESMGEEVERLLEQTDISRSELDSVATASHRRAAEASAAGKLDAEIVPLARNGNTALARDEGIRPDTSIEKLAQLSPVFREDGLLTAGNSSQISDGSAALVLASGEAVQAHGLRSVARVLAGSWVGGEPWRFAEAPVAAVRRLLRRTKMEIGDVDLFENNEAFAVSNILFGRGLELSQDRLNVHGGAIAFGHPIGCSGARILVTLLHALEANRSETGVAAICHGTGGAAAVAVERM